MLALGLGLAPRYSVRKTVDLPPGFAWDTGRFPLEITAPGGSYRAEIDPRGLVNPGIWTGAAIHVDGVSGDDVNSGLGAFDGDFSASKRTIHAAFAAGNATTAPYRVIVKPGQYSESSFTKNGNREPDQPVAILGWGGPVQYRTGPHSVNWTAEVGGTYSAPVSAVRRVFRTDLLTAEGLYSELEKAADLASCQTTPGCWFDDAGTVHVNIGSTPGASDIALIRSFHGARFLSHASDFYLEDVHCEGGITGALHLDPVASRNVVAVDCSFRYSAPSNPAAPRDAVQVRRTNGLLAFFRCDASFGAEDGWSFHEDGVPGMHVLMQDCRAYRNGAFSANSCNALTTHDSVRMIDLNGRYGMTRNGTEVHCIQSTQSWLAGSQAMARDVDGSSTAFKCSNQSFMWLQNTLADAAGGTTNHSIEANGGTVLTRAHVALAGTVTASSGGSIAPF